MLAWGRAALSVTAADELSISAGFGLHLVDVAARATTGGTELADVEAHFTSKMGDMSDYDAFTDCSIGLYTTDLDQYTDAFDRQVASRQLAYTSWLPLEPPSRAWT